MKGSDVRFLNLSLRLIFLYIIFALTSYFCMDFTFTYLLFLYFFMIVISILCMIYCYKILNISMLRNEINNKVYKKLKSNGFYLMENSPIYTTEESNGYGAVIQESYLGLNAKQRQIFENKGFIIMVGSKKELRCFSKDRFINGYFSKVGKYILLFTDCETSKQRPYIIKSVTISGIKSTFYHEWGHFIDYSNYYLSETFKFKKYFNSEKNKIRNSIRLLYFGMPCFYFRRNPEKNLYELKSSSEYFACKYSEYRRGVQLPDYLMKLFESVEVS